MWIIGCDFLSLIVPEIVTGPILPAGGRSVYRSTRGPGAYFRSCYLSANTASPTTIPSMLMSTRYAPAPNEEVARL
jgi:hypothetical protein